MAAYKRSHDHNAEGKVSAFQGSVISADGACMDVVGVTEVPLHFGAEDVVWEVIVIRDLQFDCLLGLDIRKHLQAQMA